MCEICVRRTKRLGIGKKTYGQIKARAHMFDRDNVIRVDDVDTMRAVEAHLHKIEKARTDKKKYTRKRKHK